MQHFQPPSFLDYYETWKLVYTAGNANVYLAPANTLLGITRPWRFNRPEDPVRTRQITESIKDGTYVDSMLYLAQIKGGPYFYCYDGNHRRKALLRSQTDRPVLVHIIITTSDADIKKNFITLNKSNPVPEIYTESDENILTWLPLVNSTVAYIVKKFPKYQTMSRRPRRPNFNKDKLADYMTDIFTSLQREIYIDPSDLSINYVKTKIKELNENYKQIPITSPVVDNKIKKYGCAIFAFSWESDFVNLLVSGLQH